MRSWITLCVLFCLGSMAFGDSNQVNYNFHVFSVPSTDESMALLSIIFGQVGNILPGQAGVFGVMFSKFNESMLMLNTILVAWVTIVGLVYTAGEGEFLGKKMHSIWTPLRVCISVLLLIPSKTGYCILQIMVMWVVLQGIGAADTVWNAVLTYVAVQPIVPRNIGANCAQDPSNTYCSNAHNYSDAYTKFVQPLYENLLALEYAKQNLIGVHFLYSGASSAPCDENGQPGFGNLPLMCYYFYYATLPPNESKIKLHLVGKMTFTNPNYINPAPDAGGNEALIQRYQGEIVQSSLDQLIPVLQQTAKEVVSCKVANKLTCIAGKPFQVATDTVFANEQGALEKYFANGAQGPGNNYLSTASTYGWIFAGAFYRTISSAVNTTSMAVVNNVWTNENHYNHTVVDEDLMKAAKNADSFYYPDLTYPVTGAGGNQPNLNSLNNVGMNVTAAGGGASMFAGLFYSFVQFILDDFEKVVFGNSISSFGGGSITSGTDPLMQVQLMGVDLVAHCDDIFSDCFNIMVLMVITTSVLVSIFPAASAVSTGILKLTTMYFNYMMFYVGLVFVVGLMLAVYVPLIPYVVFTFSAIGWMIVVIEAMLAAPLVAIGVASTEGHEIYGNAKAAIMLIMSVFVRPTFMIFGLIAGMILSYVAVELINATFTFVVFDSLQTVGNGNNSGANNNGSSLPSTVNVDPFELIVYLVIYVALVVVSLQKSFDLIHDIPDNILTWIGGHKVSGHSEGADKIQGFAQAGAKSASEIEGKTQKEAAGTLGAVNKGVQSIGGAGGGGGEGV